MAPQKALVVDDLAVNRLILGTILQKLGFEVLEAENGLQCIDVYNQERTQLVCVFLDLQMPVADGWFGVKGIRELESRSPGSDHLRVPVVVCTASCLDDVVDGETVAQRAVSLGANGAVRKPLNLFAVQRILDEYAPQWRSPQEPAGTAAPAAAPGAAAPPAAAPVVDPRILTTASGSCGCDGCPALKRSPQCACARALQQHPLALPHHHHHHHHHHHGVGATRGLSPVPPTDVLQPLRQQRPDASAWDTSSSSSSSSWRSSSPGGDSATSIAAAMAMARAAATSSSPAAALEYMPFGPACIWRSSPSRPARACATSSSSYSSSGEVVGWGVRQELRGAAGAGALPTPLPRADRRMSCEVGLLSAAAAAAVAAAGSPSPALSSSSWAAAAAAAAAASAAGNPPPVMVAALRRAVAIAAAQ